MIARHTGGRDCEERDFSPDYLTEVPAQLTWDLWRSNVADRSLGVERSHGLISQRLDLGLTRLFRKFKSAKPQRKTPRRDSR